MRKTKALIFEISKAGRCGLDLPKCDVPEEAIDSLIPQEFLRKEPAPLPEISQLDLMRHYTQLSQRNCQKEGDDTMECKGHIKVAITSNSLTTVDADFVNGPEYSVLANAAARAVKNRMTPAAAPWLRCWCGSRSPTVS